MRSVPNLLLSADPTVRFFFLKALPVAGAQIYYWVRDWQVLILGVLAFLLAWRWSMTVERRAERMAREILARALRLRADQDAADLENSSPALRPLASSETGVLRSQELSLHAADVDSLKLSLNSFRTCLRNILASTPVSDEQVTGTLTTEYQKLVGFSFSSFQTLPGLRIVHTNLLTQLEEGIGKLETIEPITCRQLWQQLVDLNSMARSLEEAILPDVSNLAI
jgi:hypothetical protein